MIMGKHGKALVEQKAKKVKRKMDKKAQDRLAVIIEDLCEHILHGADKISSFTKKKEIDCEAIDVAAHVNIRSSELKSLRKM
jgi:hypothetical protein